MKKNSESLGLIGIFFYSLTRKSNNNAVNILLAALLRFWDMVLKK